MVVLRVYDFVAACLVCKSKINVLNGNVASVGPRSRVHANSCSAKFVVENSKKKVLCFSIQRYTLGKEIQT